MNIPNITDKHYQNLRWYHLPVTTAEVTLRFLPSPHGIMKPGKLVWYHRHIEKYEKVLCFRTYGQDCPLCALIGDLLKSQLAQEAYKMQAVVKNYFNVLVIHDPTFRFTYNRLTPCILGANGEAINTWLILLNSQKNITDIHNGCEVKIKRYSPFGAFRKIATQKWGPIAESDELIGRINEQCYNVDSIWPDPELFHKNRIKKICTDINLRFKG